MARSWQEALTAFGQRSPMPLAIGYVVVALGSDAIAFFAKVGAPRPGLNALSFALWLGAGVALLLFVAWYRDEDLVTAAVLVALTVTIGGRVASVILVLVMSRSVGTGILLMMRSLLPLFISLLIAVPSSILLVWMARHAASAFGITPVSTPRQRVPLT
jgi:hypothetical protein